MATEKEAPKGKAESLELLRQRRADQPEKINNASLPARAPMYFYCQSCGHLADVLPEDFINPPKKLCGQCDRLKTLGWLE